MRRFIFLACAAVIALPVTAAAQDAGAEEALKAQIEAWSAGWNAGDGAAVAALYADDAVVLPPGAEAVEGAEAIRGFWSAAIEEAAGVQLALDTRELTVHGDLAIERGSYVDTAADGSHVDHGNYVVVWKKTYGSWKIKYDIFNSSMTP